MTAQKEGITFIRQFIIIMFCTILKNFITSLWPKHHVSPFINGNEENLGRLRKRNEKKKTTATQNNQQRKVEMGKIMEYRGHKK